MDCKVSTKNRNLQNLKLSKLIKEWLLSDLYENFDILQVGLNKIATNYTNAHE